MDKDEENKTKYPALFIPGGNMRDTISIMRQLKDMGIHAYLASYTGLEYGKIHPCSFTEIELEDNHEWMNRISESKKRFAKKRMHGDQRQSNGLPAKAGTG